MHDVKTLNQLIFSERFETGDMVIMVGIAVKSNLRAQAVKPMMKEFKKAVGTNTFDSKNQLHLRTATRVYTNDIPNTVHQKNVQGNGWHAVGTYSTFLLLNPPPRKRQRPSPIMPRLRCDFSRQNLNSPTSMKRFHRQNLGGTYSLHLPRSQMLAENDCSSAGDLLVGFIFHLRNTAFTTSGSSVICAGES